MGESYVSTYYTLICNCFSISWMLKNYFYEHTYELVVLILQNIFFFVLTFSFSAIKKRVMYDSVFIGSVQSCPRNTRPGQPTFCSCSKDHRNKVLTSHEGDVKIFFQQTCPQPTLDSVICLSFCCCSKLDK